MEIYSRFWIKKSGKNYLGLGRIELLERIKQSGSISKAARQMRMSYKAAWDGIDIANKLSSPESLVISSAGGGKDSGTKITEHGQMAMDTYRNLQRLHDKFLAYFDGVESFEEMDRRAQIIETALNSVKFK